MTLAVATGGGLAYATSGDDNAGTTRGAQTAKAASPTTAPVGGTSGMQPKRGVQPSATTLQGSTAAQAPPASRNGGHRARAKVDSSDEGAKDVKATRDLGKRNARATRDLGG